MPQWIAQRLIELKVGTIFLTRLPLSHSEPIEKGAVARALWSAPIIGGAVGAAGAAVYSLACVVHLPPILAATLAIAATAAATGCLHEDGLADVADGFGGGATRERKLEIMRDSRIGAFGVCALLLSFLLRIGALSSLAELWLATGVLICAGAAARSVLPIFMVLVRPARSDGMSANAGIPPYASAVAATLLGVAALVCVLGVKAAFVALLGLAVVVWFMAWLCLRQINGQTGDVLGALEQTGEVIVLLIAVAALS